MLPVATNRWQAFLYHIIVSLLIFIVLASIIYYWYPGILFEYDGGLDGIKLIAGVDFLIGPILTLCVYRLGKPKLFFDMTVIALLQVLCLAGGMWTVWNTRPVAVVYSMGGFQTINYVTYTDNDVSINSFPILQDRWPVWVAVKKPANEIPEFKNSAERFMYKQHSFFDAKHYVPFDSQLEQIMQESQTVGERVAAVPFLASGLSGYKQDSYVFTFFCGGGSGFLVMGRDGSVEGVYMDMPRKGAYEKLSADLQKFLVKLRNL